MVTPYAPYDARAVANLVLDESDAIGRALYPTSLLKILYFGHGWHLARYGAPLVAQPFEAWQHGPVVRVVYDQIRPFSGKKIDIRLTIFNANSLSNTIAAAGFSEETKNLVRAILGAYGALHPFDLSEMTHEVDAPWTEVWNAALAGLSPGARLSNGLIKDYFLRQNANDVLGNG